MLDPFLSPACGIMQLVRQSPVEGGVLRIDPGANSAASLTFEGDFYCEFVQHVTRPPFALQQVRSNAPWRIGDTDTFVAHALGVPIRDKRFLLEAGQIQGPASL